MIEKNEISGLAEGGLRLYKDRNTVIGVKNTHLLNETPIMKRIFIVSRDISLKQDGGTLVSKRNERLLRRLGFDTDRFVIPIPAISTRIKNIILSQSYGATKSLQRDFCKKLEEEYDYVFFDGSIYGGFLRLASQMGHKTVCFYHNVEAEYYKQKANQTGSLADKLMVPYIRKNERVSTEYADGIITLNRRDSQLLKSQYGRDADAVIPTSFPDRNIKSLYSSVLYNDLTEPFLLFVGTNFFANYEGLNRFVEKIAPQIDWKVKVVGNINEAFRGHDKIPANVEFIGRIESLEDYYIKASAVIAPIFTGSGLKTKIVEAISYGKTVVGFPEAFEGIEWADYPGSCIQVSSDSTFIEEINKLSSTSCYNEMSEVLFHEKLSDEAQIESLSKLFDKIGNEHGR